MNAGTIIEEIKHLPPNERAEVASFVRAMEEKRQWTPEELGAACERMVAETDPRKVAILKEQITAGFYGDDLPDA